MAQRAILKTQLVFGMVAMPVRVLAAYGSDREDVSLHWMHSGTAGCGASVGYMKQCKGCGYLFSRDDQENYIGSGYKHGDTLIEVTDADLADLPLPNKGRIELTQFVDANDIPAAMYSTMYYLEPEEVGRGPYDLLARALTDRDVLGIGTVTLRNKERLCAIRPEGNLLVLETLRRPDEIRTPPTLPTLAEPAQDMLDVAGMLIDRQTRPFDATNYSDHYQDALNQLVAAKINGTALPALPVQAKAPAAPDLMEQLKASIAKAQAA
jgi:DNA end-binding protein Ku